MPGALPILLLALLPAAGPAGPGALLRALRQAPAGGPRAAAATAPLHGLPYLPSALGEGRGPDPDPRFRLDAFDCMTFVETAVALGSASSLAEARAALDDVRYSGPPAIRARNHEVMSQWLPANAARGWVADVAAELAGPLARREEKEFTEASWRAVARAGRAIPGVPRSALPLGRYGLHVVALADLPAVAGRIPAGAILFVVRADAPERPTRVSHAGVVFDGPGGRRWVRHATSTPGVARVIEEPLERFLSRQEKALPRWPLTGISIVQIRDNRARLRSLAASGGHPPGSGRGSSPAASLLD
ncbi:MAG TPA: N-acetylmuramoyl-L-alanine amidase-like domain-containing protein [Anaeromyxobacteraceae bacterium]|nr:N-acetylmuramoyl-L-alanine amidase-like domain-containing protein [Anaeromyxobacteraceae bacterium]